MRTTRRRRRCRRAGARSSTDPDTPVAGNPKGDVSLVEFFDYRCPYCKQVEPSLEALLGEDRQLRFVYKEFPVLGPEFDDRVAGGARRAQAGQIRRLPPRA